MGSTAAMNSVNRVLEKHGEELRQELLEGVKSKLITGVALDNNLYEISVTWGLKDGTTLEGRPIDIDTLSERFPDCEVAY